VATLIVILLVMAAVKHMVVSGYEDLAYARRGKVSPRRQAAMDRAKAKQSSRYGLGSYVRDLWHDAWEDARAEREAKRAGGKPELPEGWRWTEAEDWPDPWDKAQPIEDITPKTVPTPDPKPAPAPAPTPQPTPAPVTRPRLVPNPSTDSKPTSTGGPVSVEATNFETASAALDKTINDLTVILGLAQEAGSHIETATSSVEMLDGNRGPLAEDVQSLHEQLEAKRLDSTTLAASETVVAAIAPDKVAAVQESMESAYVGIGEFIAVVEEALAAARANLAHLRSTYADAADTVATTGVDSEFLAA
jgi:type IV secretory pathway VirB10-like protein